jgi:GT2 family glycosyltransferase
MLNYNGLKYIKKTIPHVLKLNYPNYEFIIVDNGSTDGSLEFIKKFKKIKMIKNSENLGYSKGKNIGVKCARGEYVLLLDNDILIPDINILRRLFIFYMKLNNPGFVNIPLVEDDNRNYSKMYGSYYGLFGIKENKLIKISKIKSFKPIIETIISFGGLMFFNKHVWEDLGGLDESQPFNLDDDDISLRACIFGYKNYLYNKVSIIHLGKQERMDNEKFRWKYKYYFSGKAKPIFKNLSNISILIIFPLFILKTLLKTIKQSIFRNDPLLFYSLLFSVVLFIKDFNKTLILRDKIQLMRKIKDKHLFFKRFPIN